MANLARNPALDVLRFVAIVMVMGRHLSQKPPLDQHWLYVGVSHWQWGGWVGVDLFFVLSGFLIADLLFREHQKSQRINLKKFLIRRFLKIYPPLLLFVIGSCGVSLLNGLSPMGFLDRIAAELLLVQNYFWGIVAHTWSIGVEVQFYLALALLFKFLEGRARNLPDQAFKAIPWIFGAIAIACLGLRWAYFTQMEPYQPFRASFWTHLRVDSMMFGVLLSWLWNYTNLSLWLRRRGLRWGLLLASLALFSFAFRYPLEISPWMSIYGFSLMYLAAGALLLASLQSKTLAQRWCKPLAAIGSYSYSIYLWHYFVTTTGLDWMTRLLGQPMPWLVYAIWYFEVAWIVGILAAKLVEMPTLRWRDRVFPSQLR